MAVEQKEKMPVPSEIGHTGMVSGYSFNINEINAALRFPRSIETYDKMAQNVAIASALNAVVIVASRVPVYVEAYSQQTTHLNRAEFVKQCLIDSDMDHTFYDFLRQALSFHQYGFCINEKVYRYRNRVDGSKFDDGKIGIKKLPIRSQHSILKWKYSKLNRELLGVWQKRAESNPTNISTIEELNKEIFIERDRFLLFRSNPSQGNPEGLSPLASVYTAWMEVCKLKDLENIAAQKNMNGLPVLSIPAVYMSEDASDEEKEVYEITKKSITKLGIGEQNGLIIPSDRDDQQQKYWDFKLESASASNITAISNMIQTKTNEIYQCLFADVLQMGSTRGGNANLADNKASMLHMLVETRMREIFDVINSDLIPDLFRLNDWDETKLPKLRFGKLADIDMQTFAKGMQQLKATGLIAITPENVNFVAEVMQLPFRVPLDISHDDLMKLLGSEADIASRSGDGFATASGGLSGTADSASKDDDSASNLNNA